MATAQQAITDARQARVWLDTLDVEQVVATCAPRLRTYNGDPDFTRDCVHDRFAHFYAAPEKLLGAESPYKFFVASIFNRANDLVSSGNGRTAFLDPTYDELAVMSDPASAHDEATADRIDANLAAAKISFVVGQTFTARQQECYALIFLPERELSDKQLGAVLGVSQSSVRRIKAETVAKVLDSLALFDEGAFCKAHLGSSNAEVRDAHLKHCSLCAANAQRLYDLRAELRAAAPASLLALLPAGEQVGFFGRLLARIAEPINAGVDFVTRRYVEASGTSKALAVVSAAVIGTGGGAAVVVHKQNKDAEKPSAPTTQGPARLDFPPPQPAPSEVQPSENVPLTTEKPADTDNGRREAQGTDAEALTPEAGSQSVPPPSSSNSSNSSGGRNSSGTGDLAP
jgi:DNA-directed RNA polymerase specialized sigma24 family protein